MRNSLKRTAAFVLALTFVAGAMPAKVGGFLTGGNAIVAHAAETVDGITFNQSWSNNSLPKPEYDAYDYVAHGTGTVPMPQKRYLTGDITAGTVTLPLAQYAKANYSSSVSMGSSGFNGYFRRYAPLDDDNSVYLYLNGHSINMNGATMLYQQFSYYEDFIYGFYGTGQNSEVISGAGSMGTNLGGTWELSKVKLDEFSNIATLNSSYPYTDVFYENNQPVPYTYYCYPAVLNMRNTTADCTTGVNVENGTLNMSNSTINSSGEYALALHSGSVNLSGNNTINGTIQLNDNAITFASGSKLTGNITVKWTGSSLNGAPRKFTNGAGSADLTGCTFTAADGCYIEKDSSGDWWIYASAPGAITGGSISGIEPTYYIINGQTPTLNYTVKNARGEVLTKDTHYTQTIKKNGQVVSGYTSEGIYTIEIKGKGSYSGTLTQDYNIRILSTTGTANLGGYTFHTLGTNKYAITSTADWNALASYVNNGNDTTGKTFVLEYDISAGTSIGGYINSSNKYFKGTFDGNGYTLTFNRSANEYYVAPFSEINGATIMNLKVKGTIAVGSINATNGKGNAGGIVGRVDGVTNLIKNCVVSTEVGCKEYGGGFVGYIYQGSVTIEGCVADAYVYDRYNHGQGMAWCGIFIGQNQGGSATIKNSFVTSRGYWVTTHEHNTWPWGQFCYNGSATLTNVYHPGNSGAVTCGENVALNIGNPTTDYGNLKVYGNAMEYDGNTSVSYDSTVNLTLTPPSGSVVKSVNVNNGTVAVSGTGNARSFTMPNTAVEVMAEFADNSNLLDATFNGINQTYSIAGGTSFTFPNYTVKDCVGNVLTEGTDFTVVYRKNGEEISRPTTINTAGIYDIEITGMGAYTGSKTFTMSVSDFTYTTFGGHSFVNLGNNKYGIASADDWNALADIVNGGNTCSGTTFVLLNNIPVTRKIGTTSTSFNGTFDGNGRTITVDIADNSSQGIAPFCRIIGATIKNLTVTGTVSCTQYHSAGLVGFVASGTNTIENCTVSTVINGGGYVGGILGHAQSSTVNIRNCVFDGMINGDSASSTKGVLQGWADNSNSTVNNCLYIMQDGQVTDNLTLVKNGTQNVSNTYKTGTTADTNTGTMAYTVSCGTGVSMTLGTETTYGNGLTVCTNGMKYNGNTYVANGTYNITVTPPAGMAIDVVKVNGTAISPTNNVYKVTVSSANAVVNAEFSKPTYTVTWKNGNTTLETDADVVSGDIPFYNGGTPTKEGDAQYSYTFSGWSDGTNTYDSASLPAVLGNVTYTAQFSEVVNKYTVIWKNGDTVLETDENVEYGTTPTYDGATPTKDADAQYTYAFIGWSDGTNTYAADALPTVSGDVNYMAQFKEYTIVPAKAATYEADGNNAYYISDGKYYTSDDGVNFTEIAENSWIIPKLTMTPSWYMNADSSKLNMNILIPLADGYTLSDYSAKLDNNSQALTEATINNTKYVIFTFTCSAKEMADVHTLVINTTKDTEAVYTNNSLSAKSYLNGIISNNELSAYHATVKAMLRYGAAAQTYFNYNSENLANAGVEGAELSTLTDIADNSPTADAYNAAFDLTNSTYYGMNMTFTSDTTLLIAFKLNDGANIDTAKTEIEAKFENCSYDVTVSPDGTGKFLIAQIQNIPIMKLGTPVITVGSVEIKATDWLTRTANNTGKTTNLRNLCKALYAYYTAARKFL